MSELFSDCPLNVEKVTFSYKNEEMALNDVTFSLVPGTINALIGPTGSGKTTLLNLIAGKSKLKHGAVKLGQHALNHFTRKKVTSLIKINDSLPENDTCGEALEFYNQFRKEKKIDFITEEETYQAEWIKCNQLISTLSEGERKLLSIRLHLVNRPVLLLDEPFSCLDPLATIEILKTIKELKLTTIISLHHSNEFILNYFDSILVLKKGMLIYHFNSVTELKAQVSCLLNKVNDPIYDLFVSILPKVSVEYKEPVYTSVTLETRLIERDKLPLWKL